MKFGVNVRQDKIITVHPHRNTSHGKICCMFLCLVFFKQGFA